MKVRVWIGWSDAAKGRVLSFTELLVGGLGGLGMAVLIKGHCRVQIGIAAKRYNVKCND